jgi:hypothetical protein
MFVPWSATRFLRRIAGLRVRLEVEELGDNEDGVPAPWDSINRLQALIVDRRDRNGGSYEPWSDSTPVPEARMDDVSRVLDGFLELQRFKKRLLRAAGPPTTERRYSRNTGRLEEYTRDDDIDAKYPDERSWTDEPPKGWRVD